MSVTNIKNYRNTQDIMQGIRKQLRIVVLDCPYNTINDPQTQKLLGKITQFKINSYLDDWQYGVLPVDSGDFVGIHLLLGIENQGELEIIAGLKIMTHDRCREFGLEFSAFHALNHTPETLPHQLAIEQVVKKADEKRQSAGYICSWAVRPDAKKSRHLARFCRDISGSMLMWACQEFGIPHAIGFGVQRLKVDRYHEWLGFKPLLYGGQPLPVFTSKSYMNEVLTTSLIDAYGFSEEAKNTALEYRDLWESRIEIRGTRDDVKKEAA